MNNLANVPSDVADEAENTKPLVHEFDDEIICVSFLEFVEQIQKGGR